jgi:FkbM family methyltransferase
VRSGVEHNNGAPYVELADGTTLFGRAPTRRQEEFYKINSHHLPATVTIATVGVAVDVVLRYLYPHAMPQLKLPYPRWVRARIGHPQHIEAIYDLPKAGPRFIKHLSKVFELVPGQSFLDVGAYLGFGSIRLASVVGSMGKVIAVEADPENFSTLQKNIATNHLTNVVAIHRAVWQHNATVDLHQDQRQANSVISHIVDANRTSRVRATSLDALLNDLDVDSVDLVSLTINGAEVEAVLGMQETIRKQESIRLTIAGWYQREDGRRVCDIVAPLLAQGGLHVVLGRRGRVLAWK